MTFGFAILSLVTYNCMSCDPPANKVHVGTDTKNGQILYLAQLHVQCHDAIKLLCYTYIILYANFVDSADFNFAGVEQFRV